MASRLDAELVRVVGADQVREILELLSATPSPRGAEAPLAHRLQQAASTLAPSCRWTVDQDAGGKAASVLASHGASPAQELLLYSHLDTSLTGDLAADWPVSGATRRPPELCWDAANDLVSGPGIGVATAPAAAAVAAFTAVSTLLDEHTLANPTTLLLAGSGTHQSPYYDPLGPGQPDVASTGVARYLRRRGQPAAAVVAKTGPAGVLFEEPGAAFIRVRVRTPFAPVLAREHTVPQGGLAAHTATLVAAIEVWRDEHLARHGHRGGQIAAEVGIGYLSAGSPRKPDLLPGVLEAQLYAVTVPGDQADIMREQLAWVLRDRLAGTALAGCEVTVEAVLVHESGHTPPHAPLVQLGRRTWQAVCGHEPPVITQWKGSTDGAYLRTAGVDTIRLGPTPVPNPGDPRVDSFHISELVNVARIYGKLLLAWALGHSTQDSTQN